MFVTEHQRRVSEAMKRYWAKRKARPEDAWKAAQKAYRIAQRGERERALKALQKATHDALRAEVGK